MIIHFYLRYTSTFGEQLFISSKNFPLYKEEWDEKWPLSYVNEDFWYAAIETKEPLIKYQYIVQKDGEWITEGEKDREISLKNMKHPELVLIDTWNDAASFQNAYYTAAFKKLLNGKHIWYKGKKPKRTTHVFKIKAPLLKKDEVLCITGSCPSLNEWSTDNPVLLEREGNWHTVSLDLSSDTFPILYKYGIYNLKHKFFEQYEDGDNRILHADNKTNKLTVLHDGFIRMERTWRGAGVAVPVFSLRTTQSFGIGEFTDLTYLIDWAELTGLKLIQLLPVNDTSATFTAQDSYPYAAISAFALHPVYINLQAVAGKKHAAAIRSLQKKGKQLNALADVDYNAVIHYKMSTLRELFDLQGNDFAKEKEYTHFYESNEHWLKPYAFFCYLRDKWGTADFRKWKNQAHYDALEADRLMSGKTKTSRHIQFYFFIQYHLHLQLKNACDHAQKKGIVIKGDIPIGIYRNSVDAWVAPQLYHMEEQAGAPPDDFAVRGQNWGFPTYNWQKMSEDGFEWWKNRLTQIEVYFDAFRIDHILGFFRIWSIPIESIEGIMGRFVPAIPIQLSELGEKGIWFDYTRYCTPFITQEILNQLFGNHAAFVSQHFLEINDTCGFVLKEVYNTQRKVAEYFEKQNESDENEIIKRGLFNLISNVIFFEEAGSNKQRFHCHIAMENTSSFQLLDEQTREKLKVLYQDYFFNRQEVLWRHAALQKLPFMKDATNMLVCGEDLGMVPQCVPGVMKQLGILCLEVQRMPKQPNTEFLHPNNAPYLSVITPGTHDMSTVRGWWEEDRERSQRFYNIILEGTGPAPYFCESWINRAIVLQHLYAPAMWSIFSLQDILGMSENLRREDPASERINQPADPNHYWRYRMHLSLEQLMKETDFNTELKDYITNSGRAS